MLSTDIGRTRRSKSHVSRRFCMDPDPRCRRTYHTRLSSDQHRPVHIISWLLEAIINNSKLYNISIYNTLLLTLIYLWKKSMMFVTTRVVFRLNGNFHPQRLVLFDIWIELWGNNSCSRYVMSQKSCG